MSEMLKLTLPDGSVREVEEGTLPRDVVASIGPRLLRDAIATEIDGETVDLSTPLRRGGAFRVITQKDPDALRAASFRCARAGDCRATSAPRREDRIRSGD